jgi:hypothetical protein
LKEIAMGLFTESNTDQVQALQAEVKKLREASKAAVLKARKRQKNSVERANRFKKRAANMTDSSASAAVEKL